MKESLDRKEYLMQYTEQKNAEFEKILRKRAPNDDYIMKRLDAMNIDHKKDRVITNIVEDNTNLLEAMDDLREENKKL